MSYILLLVYTMVFYFPMLGRVLPPFQQRQETFLNYGLPAAALVGTVALVWGYMSGAGLRRRNDPLFWPAVFLALYTALWAAKGAIAGIGDLQVLGLVRTKLGGPIYGLSLIAVLAALPEKKRYSMGLPLLLAAAFSCQTVLSAIEAIRGVGFGKYEIGYVGDLNVETRDMLEALGVLNLGALGFKIPFSGQIGQHNGFGNQLLFYGLIFFTLLPVIQRRWQWLAWGLIGVVVFDLVANTTRVPLFAVGLAIAVVTPLYLGRNPLVQFFLTIAVTIAVIAGTAMFWDRLVDMTLRTDSFTGRTVLWQMLLGDATDRMNVGSFLLGFGAQSITTLGVYFRDAVLGSMENQFLALYLDSGIIGATGFVLAFLVWPAREIGIARGAHPLARRLAWLYLFGLLACGLTMDLHMHFTSLPLLLIAHDRVIHAVQATSSAAAASPLVMRPKPEFMPAPARAR